MDTEQQSSLEQATLLHLPPKVYPTGSLNFELSFTEPGRFVGLVTVGGSEKLVSRFPFAVGRSGIHWLHFVALAVLLLAGAIGLYRYGVRRRNKATPASR